MTKAVATLAFVCAVVGTTSVPSGAVATRTTPAGQTTPTDPAEQDYGFGSSLPAAARNGRDTWYFWTGGNQKLWAEMPRITAGNVNLLKYVDSRLHGRRFLERGAITQPGCLAATAADQYGLWMDRCEQAPVPGVPGEPTGIVGLRRFPNPAFDPARWDPAKYFADPADMSPPYLIGMTCGFCHIGFSPTNPPADPERPAWSNLAPTIGNQYFQEGKLFSLNMTSDDFRWHVASRQPPGTSDTSRFATDHINNPSAINAMFNLAFRPAHAERMRDGSEVKVPHVLKDGADSIGLAGAAMRVAVNIGMCDEYARTLHDPVLGITRPQRPFDIEHARRTCQDWRETEARMPELAAFLTTRASVRLKDAPGGSAYLAASTATLETGKRVFAENCASCHSSKQPPPGTADATQWFRDAVARDDFLENNFLSDDRRHPVARIGTNIGRAMASNAIRGHIWDQFSSETYKELPPVPELGNLYNPRNPGKPLTFKPPAGGRGYYRTPSLAGVWATAPYLHNNSVGTFVKDPSVRGRMAAFLDGMEKLLWPERRLGVQSIPVTTVDSFVTLTGTRRRIRIPAGTPVDYVARVDPTRLPDVVRGSVLLDLVSDETLFRRMLRYNIAPDFILDRGHLFGAGLSDTEKWALIEFVKTF